MTIKDDDKEAEATAEAPRVTLAQLEEMIVCKYTINGGELERLNLPIHPSLRGLTLAIVVLRNGYVLVGQSAVVSVENYKKEIGERMAYEQCLRQLWGLAGFHLRCQLDEANHEAPLT